MYAGDRREIWHLPALLFLGESPKISIHLGHTSETSKLLSFLYTPGVFKLPLPCFICMGLFVVLSLKRARTQFPLAFLSLPQPSPLIFKF